MSSPQPTTRKRILATAVELLEQSTGQQVRMADIAKAAGVSRQALYLHFKSRADLLIAATHYVDEIRGIEGRMAPWHQATTGLERLDAWVAIWGNYLAEIYGVGRALLAVRDNDQAADLAWRDRMAAVRRIGEETIAALARDDHLAADLSSDQAVDLLTAILSVRSWENLTRECGWSQEQFVQNMQRTLRRALVDP